jgi:hypothetical protein
MLPFEMELEFAAWNNLASNLLPIIFVSIMLYYGWSKSAADDTWRERKFASDFTLCMVGWVSLTFLIPFIGMSVSHPDMLLEIGGKILYDLRFSIALLIIVTSIIQVLNYRGYFRKSE